MLLNQTENSPVSRIRDYMIEISGISRANGGIIASIPLQTESEVHIEEVIVEQYSEVLTIALSWENPKDVLILELESPQGEIITISSPSKARPIYREGPYMGFQIEQPVAGIWKSIVRLEQAARPAAFQLFVFSQNPRIGGGIIAPWQDYRLGDTIPLQFQCYFDRPISGLQVTGTLILPNGESPTIAFSDDLRKDPRAGRAGNGLYSAELQNAYLPGTYTLKVVAESDGVMAVYANANLPPGDEQTYDYDTIPAFRREFTWTFTVGESADRSVEVKPNQADRGSTVRATVTGSFTHFRDGYTSFDFGEGIQIIDTRVVDDLTALLTLRIDAAATLGHRNVSVSTEGLQETVDEAGGFEVVRRSASGSRDSIIRLLILLIILLTILLLIAIFLLVQRPALIQL